MYSAVRCNTAVSHLLFPKVSFEGHSFRAMWASFKGVSCVCDTVSQDQFAFGTYHSFKGGTIQAKASSACARSLKISFVSVYRVC